MILRMRRDSRLWVGDPQVDRAIPMPGAVRYPLPPAMAFGFCPAPPFAEIIIGHHPIGSRFRDDERACSCCNGAEPGVESPESIGRNKLLQILSTYPQCGLGD